MSLTFPWLDSSGNEGKHKTQLQIVSVNDLKKGFGSSILKIIQHYKYDDSLTLKSRVQFRDKDRGVGFMFHKSFNNHALELVGTAGLNSKGLEPPSLMVSSS